MPNWTGGVEQYRISCAWVHNKTKASYLLLQVLVLTHTHKQPANQTILAIICHLLSSLNSKEKLVNCKFMNYLISPWTFILLNLVMLIVFNYLRATKHDKGNIINFLYSKKYVNVYRASMKNDLQHHALQPKFSYYIKISKRGFILICIVSSISKLKGSRHNSYELWLLLPFSQPNSSTPSSPSDLYRTKIFRIPQLS